MDQEHAALDSLPLFQLLPEAARTLAIERFVPVSFTFGQTIVREGDPADAFFVLMSGQARAVKAGEHGTEISLGVLRAGESFGEMGLLEHTVRAVTVRASSDVRAMRFDAAAFLALTEQQPEIKAYLELQIKHRHLQNFFRLYSPFANLPAPAMRDLLAALRPVQITTGAVVVREGDAPGPMYIVQEGRLRAFHSQDGPRTYLAFLRKGDVFGEMSVFKGEPRKATVEAVSPCTLLELQPADFQKLLDQFPVFKGQIQQRIEQYDFHKVARVPLDFADEVLPADVRAHEKIGPDQADVRDEGESADPAADAEPFASEDGHFKRSGKRIRRFPLIKQIDEMDCGAASLAMVCRHFGRAVSIARIRQLVHTSFDGTSLRALCSAGEDLGLAARSVQTTPGRLTRLPLPAIVHWEGNHWVVLYDVDERYARVADPAIGLKKIPREEFDKKWTGYGALFDYTTNFDKAPVAKSNLSWLWPFLKPFKAIAFKALMLALVLSGLQMVLPVFSQVVVDRVVVEQDTGLLRILMFSMTAVLVVMVISMIVQRYLLSFAAVRLDASTLDFLVRRLLALPMTYFNARRTGDIQRRLEGMRRARELLAQHVVGGLTSLVQVVMAILLMFVYSRTLTLVFLVIAPVYVLLMFYSRRWLRPIFSSLEEGFGKYHSHQIDSIKGIETVKALGAEGMFRSTMLRQFLGMAQRQFSADFTMMCYEGAIEAAMFLSMVLFLWVGAYQVMNGTLTIGGFVAFNALVALANTPVVQLLSLWDNLQYSAVLINRLNDVFENEPEQGTDHSRLRSVPTLEGRVHFRGVGFRYGGPESPAILQNIDFEVPPGKTVAVVGRSGCGKTTLMKCLSGLLEPTEGTILYDGIDMKTLSYRQLRRQIGFVLQENHLFAGTIAKNIALADDEADMDRVLWASRMANAHEFVERLPFGYETPVGETGLAISGGQRQRIAIARALYHRPAILILDEATSSLDSESERAIQQNMNEFMKGRTSFIIAHRLSTVRDADMIVVIERGKIAEVGNHDELMKRRGLYYYLVSQQLSL